MKTSTNITSSTFALFGMACWHPGKRPTLQKISLITIALLGCFAVGAAANPFKPTAAENPNKQGPQIFATAKASGNNGGSQTQPTGDLLWYNGDFNGEATGNGLANEEDTFATGFSHVYDNFEVTDTGGWDVTSVFSDNLASTNITSATWEIRSGVSVGNGGTLVASGMTMTPDITPTGRSGFGFIEFKVQVNDLTVHLDPGTYWLNVTPVDNLDGGRSFNSTTAGANCIGTPCGNDDNAFWDSDLFGVSFVSTDDANVCAPPNVCPDFSMGINGVVSGGGGQISLTAEGRKVNGINTVRLMWSGATSDQIDVFRCQQAGGCDFVLIATTENDGSFRDSTGTTGRAAFKYKVCEAGTQNCSNKKAVLFRQ